MAKFYFDVEQIFGESHSSYISDLKFINQEIWNIMSYGICEIDLINPSLNYLMEKKLSGEETLLEKINELYFRSSMLTIFNDKNQIDIDVSSYGEEPAYLITVSYLGSQDEITILEKIKLYRFADCKRFLIEFMEKYKNY